MIGDCGPPYCNPWSFGRNRLADSVEETRAIIAQSRISHRWHFVEAQEAWNGANDFILYGKGGELATNRIEDQEITMLALHLLQVCLVYINTLMIQRVFTAPSWTEPLTAEDRRAITPLLWGHINPYGLFRLDLNTRLAIEEAEVGKG
jgi:hypothetical protein